MLRCGVGNLLQTHRVSEYVLVLGLGFANNLHICITKPEVAVHPDIIGVGAQKCASSWLHALVSSHPEIRISNAKVVDFFSCYLDRGYHWYGSRFELMSGAKVYFECLPDYPHDSRAPARAHAYHSDMKALVLLRDPAKCASSNQKHEVIKGSIPPIRFEGGRANNPPTSSRGSTPRTSRAGTKSFRASRCW